MAHSGDVRDVQHLIYVITCGHAHTPSRGRFDSTRARMSCLKFEPEEGIEATRRLGVRFQLASVGDRHGQIADRWIKALAETYTGAI